MIRRCLVLFCTIGMCLWAGTAKAQLFLEEGKVVLAVSPGDRISKNLVIHNTSAQDIDVRVYWEDFAYKPPYDGAKSFFPSGTQPDTLGSWITFFPASLKLPPHGQTNISYTINVPDKMTDGHYGVLFIEQSLGNVKEAAGVKIITRVGCLFFIEPKNKVKKAELLDFSVDGQAIKGAFVNQGNIILTPKATYYVVSKDGLAVDRGNVKNVYVPPGLKAPLEIALPAKINPGEYTVVINADLEEGDVAVKEIELSKDATGKLTIQKSQD